MPVRADLADAHRLAWEHIAAPGTWWSGAERVELASTALLAIADPDPPPPWIPVSSTGRLPSNLIAPVAAHDVDVPHRPSRRHDDRVGLPGRGRRARRAAVRRALRDLLDRRRGGPLLPQHRVSRAAVAATGRRSTDTAAARTSGDRALQLGARRRAGGRGRGGGPGVHRGPGRAAQHVADGATPSTCRRTRWCDPDWRRRPGGLSRAQMELVAARLTKLRDCFY